MSYDRTFEGRFTLDRRLTDDLQQTLADLNEEEHIPGEDGKPSQEGGHGYPCHYCQWVPTDDGMAIQWDGNEKFYCAVEWLNYIIDRYLKPAGHRLNGAVRWDGSNIDDHGVIYVKDNHVEAVSDINPGPSWDRDRH